MSIASITDGLDDLMSYFYSKSNVYFTDYTKLETAENDFTLVTDSGNMVTLLKIDGVKNLTDPQKYINELIPSIKGSLANFFDGKAHSMQFWFEVDHEKTRDMLRNTLASSMASAERLGLEMDDVFEERIDNLCNWIHSESCYIALWTTPSILSKSERKSEENQLKREEITNRPNMKRGQNLFVSITAMRNGHESFCSGVMQEMANIGVNCQVLEVHDGVKEIRKSIDSEFTDDDWFALLPGDEMYPHQRKQSYNKEEWDVVYPKISEQVMPRDARVTEANVVEIGDRIYSPMYISLFPPQAQIRVFNDLFIRCLNKALPFRISFKLEGGGLNAVNFKAALASILAFTSSKNKLLKNAVDSLKNLSESGDSAILKLQASFCTWAPKNDIDLLKKRASNLARAVEGWGGCQVSELTGDPVAGVVSSGLGLTDKNIGTVAAAPLLDSMIFMPLTRPASPWSEGAVLFRSPDGKIMPYQPYSSKQTTWINLIFAKPGSGKSFLMNVCNLALCLSGGLDNLPRIAIVDVGPSSSGLISLLQDGLPNDKKHLVASHRLKMNQENAINPFDTLLGCRYPVSTEKSFLNNLMALLATDPAKNKPNEGMSDLVNTVIDDMYKRKADKGEPNKYTEGVDLIVDQALSDLNYKADNHTIWWEVVDFLFENERYREAHRAQRNAVPLLADAATSVKDERIRNAFNITMESTGEHITDAFVRLISSALEIFPIFSQPTRFDIGEARVVSLDLGEVAQAGGDIGQRVTSVMYMLARQVTAKHFYLNDQTIYEIPAPIDLELGADVPIEGYKNYHEERIKKIMDEPKRICYDEFHRTAQSQAVRDQVVLDMREGRKWKVDIMLASQSLEDFDDLMVDFSTGVFVMDKATPQTIDQMSEKFGFSSEAEKFALKNYVHPPKAGGGTFMARFDTKDGIYTNLLSATLGPIELWAFSTTAEDMVIRNALYEKLGGKKSRQLLANVYPNGSAKEDIEARRERMKDRGYSINKAEEGITQTIINELMDLYKNTTL